MDAAHKLRVRKIILIQFFSVGIYEYIIRSHVPYKNKLINPVADIGFFRASNKLYLLFLPLPPSLLPLLTGSGRVFHSLTPSLSLALSVPGCVCPCVWSKYICPPILVVRATCFGYYDEQVLRIFSHPSIAIIHRNRTRIPITTLVSFSHYFFSVLFCVFSISIFMRSSLIVNSWMKLKLMAKVAGIMSHAVPHICSEEGHCRREQKHKVSFR